MQSNYRRLVFTVVAAVTLNALAPLQVMANPNGVFYRGECQKDIVMSDFVDNPNQQNQIQGSNKVIKVVLPPTGQTQLAGGEVVKISGLRPIKIAGGGWERFTFRIKYDENTTSPYDIRLGLALDYETWPDFFITFGLPACKELKNQRTPDGWRTYTMVPDDFDWIDQLKGVPALVRKFAVVAISKNNNLPQEVQIGKVSIKHKGQDDILKDGFIAFPIQDTCNMN